MRFFERVRFWWFCGAPLRPKAQESFFEWRYPQLDLGILAPLGHLLPCVCVYCERTYGPYAEQVNLSRAALLDRANNRDYSMETKND